MPMTTAISWSLTFRRSLLVMIGWKANQTPELPEAAATAINDYALTAYDMGLLTASKEMAEYFEEGVKASKDVTPKEVANWLNGEVARILNANNIDIGEFREKVGPQMLSELILSSHGKINTATAKTVLEQMFTSGRTAAEIVAQSGVSQISDTGELEKIVSEVIKSNVQPVADYKAGKEAALKFLVGQIMKASKGRANPQVVNEVLKKKLAET